MDSLITALAEVKKLGYKTQFGVEGNHLISLKTKKSFLPDQVKIVHFYRFESESNPDDNAILYVIQTINDVKGTLIDAYGISADSETATFMRKVKNIHK